MTDLINISQDTVQPFQLESSPIRGRLVRMGSTLDTVLQQHAYPANVGRLLAETMVTAAALASALKYDGLFTLQVKSDGPVRLLIADVTHNGGVRAYAQHQDMAALAPDIPLLGKGYLAFTVDQKLGEDRYQGIVELHSDSITESVRHYFKQSEQLLTNLVTAVRQDEHGHWRGGCLLLQRMPRDGGVSNDNLPPPDSNNFDDDWERARTLLQTCTDAELTNPFLTPDALLFRLFHEEGVRVYEESNFHHECRCSQTRVETMLRSLPRDEIEALAINDIVNVTCEFCNKSYDFNKDKRNALYAVQENGE